MDFNFKITREPKDYKDPNIGYDYQKAHEIAHKTQPSVNKLIDYFNKNKNYPEFVTLIIVGLKKNKRYGEIQKYLDFFTEKHPDYLYGKINNAQYALDNNDPETALNFLGEELDLQKLYPEKESFQIDEVSKYYACVVTYLERVNRLSEAYEIVEKLSNIGADDKIIDALKLAFFKDSLEKTREMWTSERSVTYKKIDKEYPKELQLIHPELNILFEKGFDIEKDILQHLLSLPKNTLIQDLEHIILYSIGSFNPDSFTANNYDNDTCQYLHHAVILLGELQTESSLPTILEILKQEDEFFNCWYADILFETLYSSLMILGKNQLDVLFDFFKIPNLEFIARACISSTIQQIYIQYPETKEDIEERYNDILHYFIQEKDNDDIIDNELVAALINDIAELKIQSCILLIKELFELNLVARFYAGDYDSILKIYEEEKDSFHLYKQKTLEEQYQYLYELWNNESDNFDEIEQETYDHIFEKENPELIETPKVGRNDPCPCGSEKKYKKCCGK